MIPVVDSSLQGGLGVHMDSPRLKTMALLCLPVYGESNALMLKTDRNPVVSGSVALKIAARRVLDSVGPGGRPVSACLRSIKSKCGPFYNHSMIFHVVIAPDSRAFLRILCCIRAIVSRVQGFGFSRVGVRF